MYLSVDVDIRDIYYDMDSGEKEEMRELLGETTTPEFLEDYVEYLKFRLRINPNEYTATEVLDMILEEAQRE